MKTCAYCGRENGDETVCCRECGTAEFTQPTAKVPEQRPESTTPRLEERPALKLEFKELTAEEMKMDLVTLITCRTNLEADMIVSQLGGAGILAFIPDEFLMQAVSWNVNTFGYVRVQVSPKDYESAKEFLLASPEDAEPRSSPEE